MLVSDKPLEPSTHGLYAGARSLLADTLGNRQHTGTGAMEDVFIARQPIFNCNQKVVAYELLFRSGDADRAIFSDADHATTKTLLNALLEIGLDRLVGKRQAFVNVTRSYLTGQRPLPVPKNKIILEILETEVVDDELLGGVQNLCSQGYQLALDDIDDQNLYSLKLLDFVRFVKLDILATPPDRLRVLANRYKRHDVCLLAEKVETKEQFDQCRRLGVTLFQGYFFAKPNVIHSKVIPTDQLLLLHLLASLQNPDVEFAVIEDLVRKDVSLSYKLLRYINSAAFGVRQEVQSIRQALALLGLSNIRSLATLMVLAGATKHKPVELLNTAMIRAKTCELLATRTKMHEPAAAFMVGLFSLLDTMLDCPMEAILQHLPLSAPVRDALLNFEGELGLLLELVVAIEQGEYDLLTRFPGTSPIVNRAYIDALRWANDCESLLEA